MGRTRPAKATKKDSLPSVRSFGIICRTIGNFLFYSKYRFPRMSPRFRARSVTVRHLFVEYCANGYASRTSWQATESKGIAMHDQESEAILLVNTKEAARLLSVSPRKLWSMTNVDEPRLRHVRVGRLVHYRPIDLERWIESQQHGGRHDAR